MSRTPRWALERRVQEGTLLELESKPQIGDVVQGYTVTDTRYDGAIWGVKGAVDPAVIEECKKPKHRGVFQFRPGSVFALVKKGAL